MILSIFYQTVVELDNHGSSANLVDLAKTPSTLANGQSSQQRQSAVLLLKTLVGYLNAHWSHSYVAAPKEIVALMPLLCHFENDSNDEELKKDCRTQLIFGLGKALLHRQEIPHFLEVCQQVSFTLSQVTSR